MGLFGRLVPLLKQALGNLFALEERFDRVLINQGAILARLDRATPPGRLADHEFKVFSQWGEDGIIQYLVNNVAIGERSFVEFGVEDFQEANCRFLMMKDGWRGFVIDADAANIARLRGSYFYWQYQLDAAVAFITRENINGLLAQSGLSPDLGLLSIDLDGNDYHILEAIEGCRPRILVCEYNAVFGPVRAITIPYQAAFSRRAAHASTLYWGASLAALTVLAQRKGYALVGTNGAGCNAFYVREDLLNDRVRAVPVEAAFTMSKFRESRAADGTLSHVGGEDRLRLIAGLPVVDVLTGRTETL